MQNAGYLYLQHSEIVFKNKLLRELLLFLLTKIIQLMLT